MELAVIGQGKMGGNMTRRLLAAGHDVVAFDHDDAALGRAAEGGARTVARLDDVAEQLAPPRVAWIMVPAGEATRSVVSELAASFAPDDVIVDGGNSHYRSTMRLGDQLARRGVHLVDAGTSGGVWGRTEGYSLMVGGDEEAVAHIRPALESLAPETTRGWARVGPRGAGHFVKMVHNGIEYGLMAAYAEGLGLLAAQDAFPLDLPQVVDVWRHGSVVRSWLLDLTARALEHDPDLESVRGWVDDSGEGRWTVQEAVDLAVPAPVIASALFARFSSRQSDAYADRLLAALRREFGGHAVRTEEEAEGGGPA